MQRLITALLYKPHTLVLPCYKICFRFLFSALLFLSVACNKTDHDNNTADVVIAWKKTFGGSSIDYSPYLIDGKDGSYVFAATTSSSDGDVSLNHGPSDIWVVKIDTTGNIVWQKSLGGTSTEQSFSITASNDGGYVVNGFTFSNDGDVSLPPDVGGGSWIAKLDINGNLLWSNIVKPGLIYSSTITNSPDGGYFVSGSVLSVLQTQRGWIIKTDNSGTVLWLQPIIEPVNDIKATTDGGAIITGHFNTRWSSSGGSVSNDGFVTKLDTDGNPLWEKIFSGTQEDSLKQIVTNNDGTFTIVGNTNSNDGDFTGNHGGYDILLMKLDANGNKLWQKLLGGNQDEHAYSIITDEAGGYIIAGSTRSVNSGDVAANHGNDDAWIIRTDADGNITWQNTFGGTGDDRVNSILKDSKGRLLFAGTTNSNDGDVEGNHGNEDIWIARVEKK